MKAVKTLIKLYTRDLDDRRRKLAALQSEQDRLKEQKQRTEEALQAEQLRAQSDTSLLFSLPAFVEGTRKRIWKFANHIGELEVRILKARHEISQVFGELKRYEIYDEMKEKEAAQKLLRRENEALDEVGIRGFTVKDADR